MGEASEQGTRTTATRVMFHPATGITCEVVGKPRPACVVASCALLWAGACSKASRPRRCVEAYFIAEVQPHVPDAWIDASKLGAKDGEIGIVGFEMPFNRHFYQHQPPRPLAEIDFDLDAVSAEIMALLREVQS